MSLITALTLAGLSNTAHAESPVINPVSLADFLRESRRQNRTSRFCRDGWLSRSTTLHR